MPQQGGTRPGRYGSIGLFRRIRRTEERNDLHIFPGRHGLLPYIYQRGFDPGVTLNTIQFDEIGTGTDQISDVVTKAVTEAGTGADALTRTTTKILAETGTGADALTRTITKTLAETGTGTDAQTKQATKTVAEAGSGADALNRIAQKSQSEVGVGADALLRSATEQLAEVGVGSDQSSEATAEVFAETGVGSDVPFVVSRTSFADSGVGTDNMVLSQRITIQLDDVGVGTDDLTMDTTIVTTGTGDVGWHQRGSGKRTGRRGLSRTRVHARPPARVREVVLNITDAGFGSDVMSFEIRTEEPPLFVSDILSAADDLQDDITDLLMAGVI